MKQTTVSKLQIAQAKMCVEKADKYSRILSVILELCQIALPLASNKKFPDDFQVAQKRSLETIINDLKSMNAEVADMALIKAERVKELTEIRKKQLGGKR